MAAVTEASPSNSTRWSPATTTGSVRGPGGTEGRVSRKAYSSSWVRSPARQVQESTYTRVSMPVPGASSRGSTRRIKPFSAP